MITDPDEFLLDVGRLAAADLGGLLPAAAGAGAQVRSVSSAADVLDRFVGHTPRALVILAVGRAAVDAGLGVALLGPRIPFPVIVAAAPPAWIGALDVVLALAGDAEAGHPELVEGIETARRRGATVLVRAARFGPVAFAAGADLLVPSVPAPEALTATARVLLVRQVAAACGAGRVLSVSELEDLAELADSESLACGPMVETFVNPAKTLALHLHGHAGILIGADPVTAELAAHGASVMAELTGTPVLACPPAALVQSTGLLSRLQTRADMFADPFDEGLSVPLRPVLLRISELSVPPGLPRGALDRLAGLLHVTGPVPDPGAAERESLPASAIALLVRLDFAAVYLGLLDGQVLPADVPGGLSPHSAANHRLSPDTGSHRQREDEDLWN